MIQASCSTDHSCRLTTYNKQMKLSLPQPFFVLAPMDDVTDTVFRQIVADLAAPDLFFTEFVNADGLQSAGRVRLLPKLQFTLKEKPIIAQIWGKEPDNFYKTARELVAMGFDGVDINFGCPDRNVVRNGTCSAFILPENREQGIAIVQAVREGVGDPHFPISVKTRLGFNNIDLSWHELLLKQKLNMLTIHGRTKAELSAVPTHWDKIGEIVTMRNSLSPETLIIGNGDVRSRVHGLKLALAYQLDGIMIGRGIFHDPYAFRAKSPWGKMGKAERVALYRKHVALFLKTWQKGERRIHTLNKFCKIYINGFDGAKELREQFMQAKSAEELQRLLDTTSFA